MTDPYTYVVIVSALALLAYYFTLRHRQVKPCGFAVPDWRAIADV
jgi:hypothetical protein